MRVYPVSAWESMGESRVVQNVPQNRPFPFIGTSFLDSETNPLVTKPPKVVNGTSSDQGFLRRMPLEIVQCCGVL